MTNGNGDTLTEQGAAILRAVNLGLSAMTAERWAEIRRDEREAIERGEDDCMVEWDAPEFAAAREATSECDWEFTGWRDVANNLDYGYARLGAVDLKLEATHAE